MWHEKTGLKKGEAVGVSCLVDVCDVAFSEEQVATWEEVRPHRLSALVVELVKGHQSAVKQQRRNLLAEWAQHHLRRIYNAMVSYAELYDTVHEWMRTQEGREALERVFGAVVGDPDSLLEKARALADPSITQNTSSGCGLPASRTLNATEVSKIFDNISPEVVEPLLTNSQQKGAVEARLNAAGMLEPGSTAILADMLADTPWSTRLREVLLGPGMSVDFASIVAGRLRAEVTEALEGTHAALVTTLHEFLFSLAPKGGHAETLVDLARMPLERDAAALVRRYTTIFDDLLSAEAVLNELKASVNWVFRGRLRVLASTMRRKKSNNSRKAASLEQHGQGIARTVAQDMIAGMREHLNAVLRELAGELESLVKQALDRLNVANLDGSRQVSEAWDHSSTDFTVDLCCHFRNTFARILLVRSLSLALSFF